MQPRESLKIPASIDLLGDVQAFVRQQAEQGGVPDPLMLKLDLVVEELFVNVSNYAYPDSDGQVEIRCFKKTDQERPNGILCLCIHDWGPPFNPLEREAPALDADLEDRPIGGLGIFLINEMADECSYTRKENANEFRACFWL